MSLFPVPTDYTDKDFEALRARVFHLIAQVFPTWTETTRANFSNILVESFCFTSDVNSFYQDQQARNTRWGTADQRYALIALAKLISYELETAHAATVELTFSIATIAADDVTIPAGTRVKTADLLYPVYFTLLAEAVIPQGSLNVTGDAEHSEAFVDDFIATGVRDEEFVLSQVPFLDGSQSVVIGPATWTEVDNFLDSASTDQHYILFVDQNDRATIRTGDGTNGVVPTPGAAVAITYKTGGGETGNVEADTLTKLVNPPTTDDSGNPITLTVNNVSAASGGIARETIAQARVRAPRSLRVLNRAVTRTDFEDLAVQVQGVARALMLTRNEDVVIPEAKGWLYIVPVGGGTPTGTLKDEVYDFINDNYPTMLTFSWDVKDPVYWAIDITAYIYLETDAVAATVGQAVLTELRSYFSPLQDDGTPNLQINFGFYYKDSDGDPEPQISWSVIHNLINDVTGVRKMGTPADAEGMTLYGRDPGDPFAAGTSDDVTLLVRQFPVGGKITLWNGDTSTKILDEVQI